MNIWRIFTLKPIGPTDLNYSKFTGSTAKPKINDIAMIYTTKCYSGMVVDYRISWVFSVKG
jgi:hypothetical protein